MNMITGGKHREKIRQPVHNPDLARVNLHGPAEAFDEGDVPHPT